MKSHSHPSFIYIFRQQACGDWLGFWIGIDIIQVAPGQKWTLGHFRNPICMSKIQGNLKKYSSDSESNYLTVLSPICSMNIIINLRTRKTKNNTTITFVNMILTLTIMKTHLILQIYRTKKHCMNHRLRNIISGHCNRPRHWPFQHNVF